MPIAIKQTRNAITGEMQIPVICMKLLLDLAKHRDSCDECFKAYRNKTNKYCITGISILEELYKQPEVTHYDISSLN